MARGLQRDGQPTGAEKAAILLISLGPEASASILKRLSPKEVELLAAEMASLKGIDNQTRQAVVKEFRHMCMGFDYAARGGIDYARGVLERALGRPEAEEIISRLKSKFQRRPFEFARRASVDQLVGFLEGEHPQTIALTLCHLSPGQAAAVLRELPASVQAIVAKRVASMGRTSPDALNLIEEALQEKVASVEEEGESVVGGIDAIVEILNKVDRSTEKVILEQLAKDDPELAEEIKHMMFVFEDIVLLDDRAIQRVLREVDQRTIALALKTASSEVQEVIFRNMSKRASQAIREDAEVMGPVRLREVEEAQGQIVNAIRRLDEAGEIVIARGGEDTVVV